MSVIKVKPKDGQKFKSFDVDLVDITWKNRCELNDKMIEAQQAGAGKIPSFTFWGEIVLDYTKLSEDELVKLSTDEIIGIANAVFESANAKKK